MGESSLLPIGGMRADLGVEEGSARMGGLLVSSSESSGTVVNDVATVVNVDPPRPAIARFHNRPRQLKTLSTRLTTSPSRHRFDS